jgi:predicted transposase/invertase (TIGR01784 family)
MAHPRLLDPKLDLVFKLLYAKPKNVELLISFLNSILTLPAHIKSLEVLNPELPKETVDDKGILLDVRVRFENDVEADIEMQSRAVPGRRERALYYWARLFSGQLQRGDDFTELRRCVVVFVFDFIEFDGGDLHSVVSARDERRNQKLSDHLDLHFIQLPNLMNAQNQDDERLLRQLFGAGAPNHQKQKRRDEPFRSKSGNTPSVPILLRREKRRLPVDRTENPQP